MLTIETTAGSDEPTRKYLVSDDAQAENGNVQDATEHIAFGERWAKAEAGPDGKTLRVEVEPTEAKDLADALAASEEVGHNIDVIEELAEFANTVPAE